MGNNCTKPPPEPRPEPRPNRIPTAQPNGRAQPQRVQTNAGGAGAVQVRRQTSAQGNRYPAQAPPQPTQGAASGGATQLMLPPGWEIRLDLSNRIYYVDHNTRTTSWHPPRQVQASGPPQAPPPPPPPLPSLPPGWEERCTPGDSRKYYVDHNTKMTSWVRPTWGSQGARYFAKRATPTMTAAKRCETPAFQQRRITFRNAMAMTSSKDIVQLVVSRDHILEVSAQEFENLNPQQLRSRIRISFPGESEAVDWGGVAQEWFLMIVPALLDASLGLFELSPSHDKYQINPNPNPDQVLFRQALFGDDLVAGFKFVGRVLGKALRDSQLIRAHFTLPFYKLLLNAPFVFDDLDEVDPEYYTSLKFYRDTPSAQWADYCLDTQFTTMGPDNTEVELKEGGAQIEVTDENKDEFLELKANYVMHGRMAKERQALLNAFNEVVDLRDLTGVDPQELELMFSGTPDISVDDWEANTDYDQYEPNDRVIKWFWEVVKSWDHDKQATLLQFVTGSSQLPAGGFKCLMGASQGNGPPIIRRFRIRKLAGHELPRAHTCFNVLDLPPYKKKAQVIKCMNIAVDLGSLGFGME